MKRAKQGRGKSLDSEKIEATIIEKAKDDKSVISRRREENFDKQRQGIGRTHTCTFTEVISRGFLTSGEDRSLNAR